MRTYLLEWNTRINNFSVRDFKEAMLDIDFGDFSWSASDWNGAHSGDNFFLVKTGEDATGIVMSGFLTSEPELSLSGEYTVKMKPLVMINPDGSEDLFGLSELEGIVGELQCNGSLVAELLPKETDKMLDTKWEAYLEMYAKTGFDGKNIAKSACPPGEIDDAIEIASETLYDMKDGHGKPLILKSLAEGMAQSDEMEMICGFLSECVRLGECSLGYLRRHGFSEEVADRLREYVR